MSFQSNGTDIGTQAAATDLSGSQFRFVKMVAGGWDVAGDGDDAEGILQNKPAAGQTAIVRIAGMSKLVASAAIARGASIASTADGRGVTANVGTQNVSATAVEAASAGGAIIAVLVQQRGLIVAD